MLAAGILAATMLMGGCEVDSFFDPSKTGRFENMPTTIPILERIDAIEGRDRLTTDVTQVTREDLLPTDLTYRMSPGDAITVEVPELLQPGRIWGVQKRIDTSGYFRIPTVGEVPAAGLTTQEFEDEISRRLAGVMENAVVTVSVDEGIGFQYTLYGLVQQVGVYPLRRPDMRIREAMAMAGGLPDIVSTVYVIRDVPLTQSVGPYNLKSKLGGGGVSPPSGTPQPQQPVDIEELIRQMDKDKKDGAQPGVLRMDGEPVIDIDDLAPATPPRKPAVPVEGRGTTGGTSTAPGTTPGTTPGTAPAAAIDAGGSSDSFIFVEERGEWVRVKRQAGQGDAAAQAAAEAAPERDNLLLERIIEIPAEKIRQGDAAYNIVIRPNDAIYVREPYNGFIYVDGEVLRAGVYGMPPNGSITLSRIVTAAGGLNPVAIPERVDLIRKVAPNREATIRVNLAAIRRRTEPDIFLKPDDHIIVGTSFIATPLAILRSGFRATYGFGFLLDRNFGNDVFGAPPGSQFGTN
jgi:polysaccharide biosynthesis/export protein